MRMVWNRCGYRRKVSDIFYLAVVHLDHFSFEFLLAALLVVELAAVVLGQSVAIAVHKAALALYPQQPQLLVTIETPLAVFLLLLGSLQSELLHGLGELGLSVAEGSGGLGWRFLDDFFLFVGCVLPAWSDGYL